MKIKIKRSLSSVLTLIFIMQFAFTDFQIIVNASSTTIFNENFTTDEGWAMDVPFNQAGYTPPTKFTYAVPSGKNLSSHKVKTLPSGETVLEIDGSQGGNNFNRYIINKTGLNLSGTVVMEAKYRFNNSAGRKRFMVFGTGGTQTYFEGSFGEASAYQAYGINDAGTGLTGRIFTAPTFPQNNDGYSDWYQAKMVMYKNANGKYIYDLYTKASSSVTSWKFERTMIPSNDEGKLLTVLTQFAMETFVMSGSTDKMQIDWWKAYTVTNPYVSQSSIQNNQTNVSSDTTSIDITFDQSMNESTLNTTNIKLYNVTDSEYLSYNSVYNSVYNKYALDIPSFSLDQGKQYKIEFSSSNIKSSEGLSLISNDGISFTITPPDLEIIGTIGFTATLNSNTLLNNLTTESSSVYSKVTVKKNIANNSDIIISVCLFDENNSLRKINYETRTVNCNSGQTQVFNDVGVTGISPKTGWKAKVFVWDSILKRQAILANVAEIVTQ